MCAAHITHSTTHRTRLLAEQAWCEPLLTCWLDPARTLTPYMKRERETERYPATPLPPDEHQRRAVRGSTARAFGVPPCPQHVDPALKHCSSVGVVATGQQQQQQQPGGMPLLLPCDYRPGDGDTTALQYPGCYGRRMCWALWQLGALAEQLPPSGAARAGPGAPRGGVRAARGAAARRPAVHFP
eukprot:SAG25_NODE_473_length_7639_cov_9.447082_5_plen_185_part_00